MDIAVSGGQASPASAGRPEHPAGERAHRWELNVRNESQAEAKRREGIARFARPSCSSSMWMRTWQHPVQEGFRPSKNRYVPASGIDAIEEFDEESNQELRTARANVLLTQPLPARNEDGAEPAADVIEIRRRGLAKTWRARESAHGRSADLAVDSWSNGRNRRKKAAELIMDARKQLVRGRKTTAVKPRRFRVGRQM